MKPETVAGDVVPAHLTGDERFRAGLIWSVLLSWLQAQGQVHQLPSQPQDFNGPFPPCGRGELAIEKRQEGRECLTSTFATEVPHAH